MAFELALTIVERERDEAIARHVADLERWEDRRREDQHHFRNVLAMVRAMVRRAADDASSVEMYCGQLDGRLAAYIHAQALVARDGDADLETMIADELLRFGIRLGEGAELVGEPVAISDYAAGLLALLFHELIASLALPGEDADQHLAVTWESDDDGRVTIAWVRRFGAAQPSHGEGLWIGWIRQALTHQLQIEVEEQEAEGERRFILHVPAARTSSR